MKRRNRAVAMAFAGAGLVALVMGPRVGAEEPVPVVGPHAHYVVTADGDRVPVGPDACTAGKSIAFDQFHFNGHKGVPGDLGVVVGGGCP